MIVELNDLKSHLRVDHDDEDLQIAAYGAAAEAMVKAWVRRPIYPDHAAMPLAGDPRYSPHQMVADDAIKVAIKQLVGRIYHEREGSGGSDEDAVLPLSVRALLAGHVVWPVEVDA